MNANRMKVRLLLSAGVLVACCGLARGASVTISLPRLEAAAGSDVQFAVAARQAEGLGPLQMDLVFDAAALEFVAAAEGGGQSIGLFDWNLLEPGRLRLAMTGDPNQPIQGDDDLFLLTFRPSGSPGQVVALFAEDVSAWEQSPEAHEMRITAEAGAILITSGGLPFWLMAAAGIGVVTLLFAGFLALRSRGSKQVSPATGHAAATGGEEGPSRFCSSCGARISPEAKFCPFCGNGSNG